MKGIPDDELNDIKTGLNARLEDLCEAILGNPTIRSRGEWRWGGSGGMSVVMSGARRGLCKDFRDGEKGTDPLGFIRRHECGDDWKRTLDWARSFLGLAPGERPKPVARPRRDRAGEEQADAAKIERARGFWRQAVPVNGTLAEDYLNTTRGILTPPGGWPDCVRFHPGRRALILAATTEAGEVQAVQLVHLTAEAAKRSDEPGRPTKQSFGPQAGAVVRLPATITDGIVPDALQTAEGPETGLSVWASTGRETWIALGSASKLDLPRKRQVIICGDDDPRDAPASQAMRKAYGRWVCAGLNVVAAFPWNPRVYDRSDFNDLLRQHGVQAVQARIIDAIQPKGPPPSGRQTVELGEAGRLLRKAMSDGMEAALGYDPEAAGTLPPVRGIKITVGGGKSYSARSDYALAMLVRLRAAGDKRNVAMAVPTHKLADEQLAAMLAEFNASPLARTLGLIARVWRGRMAEDPGQPGRKMCHDPQAIEDAHAAGISEVQTKVCRNIKSGDVCPFFAACGYQQQRQQRADFWIVPHEMLFIEKPDALGNLAGLIVDEAAWQKGLEGVSGKPLELTLDSLNAAPILQNDPKGNQSARLRNCYAELYEALASQPVGPISRDHLEARGISVATGKEGAALSWQRVVEPEFRPGMTAEARKALMADAGENRHAMRVAGIFSAVTTLMAKDGPKFSGWLSLGTKETSDGTLRVVRRKGRKDIRAGWICPTVIIDAILDPDLLRPYWPQIEVTADIEIQAPHQHVWQVIDQAFAKSRLVPSEASEEEAEARRQGLSEPSKRTAENDRRDRNSGDVLATLRREARRHRPARVLVVAQQAVELSWRALGNLPANMDLAHHNAVAGRDEWKNAPLVAVVGRTLPPPVAVEKIAEALTGSAVMERLTQYQKVPAPLVMLDGSKVAVEAERHVDPMAEAVRWQICEGELIQIIGRGRGCRRTDANPLTVLVLTNVPLPVPLAGVTTWAELEPSLTDTMLSQKGVALETSADAFACFPHLWPTPNAAKQAFKRERWGTFPIKSIIYGECTPPLPAATYQKAGAGMRPVRLTFDPEMMPPGELRGWLEDQVGELAWLRIDGEPPEGPEPSPPAVPHREAQEAAHGPQSNAAVGLEGDSPSWPPGAPLSAFPQAPGPATAAPILAEGANMGAAEGSFAPNTRRGAREALAKQEQRMGSNEYP